MHKKRRNRLVFRIPFISIPLIIILIWNYIYPDITEYGLSELVPVECQFQSIESSKGYRVSTAYIIDENQISYHYMGQDITAIKKIPRGQTIKMLVDPNNTWYTHNICYDRQIAYLEVNGKPYYTLEDYSAQKQQMKNSSLVLSFIVITLLGVALICSTYKSNPWIAQNIRQRTRKREEQNKIAEIRKRKAEKH